MTLRRNATLSRFHRWFIEQTYSGRASQMTRDLSTSLRRATPVAGAVLDFFGTDAASRAPARRVALIGGFAPRKCGIATFTTDVFEQLGLHHPELSVDLHVIDSPTEPLPYPDARSVIRADQPEDYRIAARRINEDAVDAVWLQHEYGIFGGEAGAMVLELLDRVAAPLIVTLHTVLASPSAEQRAVLDHILDRASGVMVMSEHGRDVLAAVYGVDPKRVTVIAHGAPDRPFGRHAQFKARAGLEGKNVIMTFGLLGQGKGLETAIEALPAIVAAHPNTVYRIVGATHPNLVAAEGEAYRDSLMDLARQLGVADHVLWENRFLETGELLDQLEACDIYLTPYPNLQQSTSGTLSYAVALGKAVVSTPYLHARELLADGVGALVPPRSAQALADAVNALLGDPAALDAMQRRAYARGRETIWPRFAESCAQLVNTVAATAPQLPPLTATPGTSGVWAMCDSTGMLQHAIGVVPDRRHGYCLDDNVRALMLMGVADSIPLAERQRWATVFASFVQHAWNPEAGRFRNFMAFDRSWCEDVGSEDSNGRALWALGHAVAHAPDAGLGAWARQWYDIVLDPLGSVEYPRSIAFAVLGAAQVLAVEPDHRPSRAMVERGGAVLHALLAEGRRPDWAWFEAMLGYDNPRLPEALIRAGHLMNRADWLESGLEALRFIVAQQTTATGQFRAIGSETFTPPHAVSYEAKPFDQQPLEAWAAVEACAAAWQAEASWDEHGARGASQALWRSHAQAAYRWFLGANDRAQPLGDLASGRCRDGITPRGINANCGAESILAFQLAHYALAELERASGPRVGSETAALGQSFGPSSKVRSVLGDRAYKSQSHAS
nr:glycosyltransferase family 4 protein [Novosphingobium sp. AAP1]